MDTIKVENPYKPDLRHEQTIGALLCDAHIVFNSAIHPTVRATLAYLEAPCTEHPVARSVPVLGKPSLYEGTITYTEHRRNCSRCISALNKEYGVEG
jgi:hypothetical protein